MATMKIKGVTVINADTEKYDEDGNIISAPVNVSFAVDLPGGGTGSQSDKLEGLNFYVRDVNTDLANGVKPGHIRALIKAAIESVYNV